MTTKTIARSEMKVDPELEDLLQKDHAELTEQAKIIAQHYAKDNRPALTENSFIHFIPDIKSGYEMLHSKANLFIQPQTHLPLGRMDADFGRETEKKILGEIKALELQIANVKLQVKNYHPGNIPLRILLGAGTSVFILIGETFLNAAAAQVITENLLFAIGLALTVSVCVLAGAHLAAFGIKAARSKKKKTIVVLGSLFISTAIFTVLAVIRSQYLEQHNVHLSPLFFIAFNLLFFFISVLLSYVILPVWEEIKMHWCNLKLLKAMTKWKRKKEKLENEITANERQKHEIEKERVRMILLAEYIRETIRKMYLHTVGIFMAVNNSMREDRQTPSCFTHSVPELNLEDITLAITSPNKNHT